MDKAERQRILLLILLSALIAYVGWNGVGAFRGVKGLRAEAQAVRVERDRLQQDVASAQVLVAKLDEIKKKREALESQLKELSRRLPSEHESPEVLRSVEALARKSGLTVSQVKRRPGRPQELYVELPMDVGISGGFKELVRFADQLSQLSRLVTLNEFRVQGRAPGTASAPAPPPTPADGPGSVQALLVAVVYQALPVPGAAPATKQ